MATHSIRIKACCNDGREDAGQLAANLAPPPLGQRRPSRDVGSEMEDVMDNAGFPATFETTSDSSGTAVLKLFGELDIASAGPIRTAIDAIVTKRPERVVIDLSELRFVDSSGLSLFLIMADQVAEVELRNPSEVIRKIIEVTGLSDTFVVTP